jgi:rod shape-determining protein MreD
MSIIIVLNYVLQTTIFRSLAIGGVKPETWIAIVVCYAWLRDDIEGCFLGFFAGLLRDVFFGRFLGFFALLGALTGFLCGKPFKSFFRHNYGIPVAMTAAAVFACGFIFYLTHFLVLARMDFGRYMTRIILPEVLYTTVISAAVFAGLYQVNKALERWEAKRRQNKGRSDPIL